jgi:hypothetical protein
VDKDPLCVWVDALLRGKISVDDACETCTVTSNEAESDHAWGNPPEVYTHTPTNTFSKEFSIDTSGTYFFTLTCQGSDPEDIAVDNLSLETVEALNLPWWQEIIPVLQGFLGGIWR